MERYNWLCHAYCLMGNHYHLLIETPDGNLSQGMRQLNDVYTQTFNRRHRRVGHVLQGRFKAILVDKDNYLLELGRYIVLNPVHAKMVKHTNTTCGPATAPRRVSRIPRPFPQQGFKDKPARDKVIHQAHREYGYTLVEIGRTLGLHYTTVSKVVNRD